MKYIHILLIVLVALSMMPFVSATNFTARENLNLTTINNFSITGYSSNITYASWNPNGTSFKNNNSLYINGDNSGTVYSSGVVTLDSGGFVLGDVIFPTDTNISFQVYNASFYSFNVIYMGIFGNNQSISYAAKSFSLPDGYNFKFTIPAGTYTNFGLGCYMYSGLAVYTPTCLDGAFYINNVSFTSTLTGNITDYTTNGTVVPLSDTNYPVTYKSNNYYSQTYTVSPSVANFTGNLSRIGSFRYSLVNGNTSAALSIASNVTMSFQTSDNQTKYINLPSTSFGNVTFLEEGRAYTLVVTAPGFSQSTYSFTYSEAIAEALNIITLYPTGSTANIVFTVQNENLQSFQNVLVTVEAFNSTGQYQTIGSVFTDATGLAIFPLDTTKQYRVTFTADGYQTITTVYNSLALTTTQSYTIIMNPLVGVIAETASEGMISSYSPTNRTLISNTSQVFWFNVTKVGNVTDLSLSSITLYANNSIVLTTTSNSPNAAYFNLTQNTVPYINQTIQVKYYYVKQGFNNSYSTVVSYYIQSAPIAGSLEDAKGYFDTLPYADRILLWSISTLIAIVFVGAFSRRGDVTATLGAFIALIFASIILGATGSLVVFLMMIVILAFVLGFASL